MGGDINLVVHAASIQSSFCLSVTEGAELVKKRKVCSLDSALPPSVCTRTWRTSRMYWVFVCGVVRPHRVFCISLMWPRLSSGCRSLRSSSVLIARNGRAQTLGPFRWNHVTTSDIYITVYSAVVGFECHWQRVTLTHCSRLARPSSSSINRIWAVLKSPNLP